MSSSTDLKKEKAKESSSAGFFGSKPRPPKDEPVPLLVTPPAKGSGTFRLFRAKPKKAAQKNVDGRI